MFLKQLVLFLYAFVTLHNGSVPIFDGKKILILHIHILSKFGISRGSKEAVYYVHHLLIAGILSFVYVHDLSVMPVFACLVEHTENLLKSVVYVAVKTWYLHYDTVVNKAVHKRVWQPLGDLSAFIVV